MSLRGQLHHEYEATIEQRARWGPTKWHGNVSVDSYDRDTGEQFGYPLEYRGGWWAWTRRGIERKLTHVIRKEQREDQWAHEAVRLSGGDEGTETA